MTVRVRRDCRWRGSSLVDHLAPRRLGSDQGGGAGQTASRHVARDPQHRGIGTARGEYRGRSAGSRSAAGQATTRGPARSTTGGRTASPPRCSWRSRSSWSRRRSRRCAEYFSSDDDILSLLTIPIIPNVVYGALLASIGVALNRRLRAAWWLLVIWWIVLPQLARVVALLDGGSWLNAVGFVLMSVVLVQLWRCRRSVRRPHQARLVLGRARRSSSSAGR